MTQPVRQTADPMVLGRSSEVRGVLATAMSPEMVGRPVGNRPENRLAASVSRVGRCADRVRYSLLR
jgi:hypothetical protein